MISFLRKTAIVPKGGPGAAWFVCDKQGRIIATTKKDGTTQVVLDTHSPGATAKTAAYTVVLPDDDGKTFYANSTTSFALTLPDISAANKGMRVTLVAQQVGATTGHRFTPHSSDTIKFGTANQSLQLTAATGVVGDMAEIESDGVSNWIVRALVGVWAKV